MVKPAVSHDRVRLPPLVLTFFALLCAPAGATDVLAVQTNAPDGRNAVEVFTGTPDGDLEPAGRFRTGQSGTGRTIPSQGTLATTADGRFLAVLDAGSSTVTVFRVGNGKLARTDRIGSGGRQPVSIAAAPGDRFVVLNAGPGPNLAGFDLRRATGDLVPAEGLSKPLSQADASPYAVAVSPSGRVAVSYEDGSAGRDVELFALSGDQLTSRGMAAVEGGGPGALAFLNDDTVLVGRMSAEGPGLASYAIGDQGLTTRSLIEHGGTDVCWVNYQGGRGAATSPNSVNTFPVATDGSLGELRSRGLRGRTSDVTIGERGRRLYVLNERRGQVRILTFNARSLAFLGSSPGMPGTTTGIVDLPNNIGGFSN